MFKCKAYFFRSRMNIRILARLIKHVQSVAFARAFAVFRKYKAGNWGRVSCEKPDCTALSCTLIHKDKWHEVLWSFGRSLERPFSLGGGGYRLHSRAGVCCSVIYPIARCTKHHKKQPVWWNPGFSRGFWGFSNGCVLCEIVSTAVYPKIKWFPI